MIQRIDLDDELNLYLVMNGLKPASIITLNPTYSGESIKLRKEDINSFKETLGNLVLYKPGKKKKIRNFYNDKGKRFYIQKMDFYIGKDELCLERLLKAKNEKEEGLALGFPEEAVKVFGQFIDGEKRDGMYNQICLAKAEKEGIKIPSWMAYIGFVPEQLDIVNNNISASTQALGIKYQEFVRKNNPELAERIEKEFDNQPLPDDWKKRPDGNYILIFNPKPEI